MRNLAFALLLIWVSQFWLPSLFSQEVVTNESVVKLVRAHLSAPVIVEQIRANPGKFDLTTEALIRLKAQGVPDEVIAAMQAKGHESLTKTDQKPAKGCASPNIWQVSSMPHEGTKGPLIEGSMCQPTGDTAPGIINVTLTCREDSLIYQFVFHSEATPPIGFLRYKTGDGLVGANFRVPVDLIVNGRKNEGHQDGFEKFGNSAHLTFLNGPKPSFSRPDFSRQDVSRQPQGPFSVGLTLENAERLTVEFNPRDDKPYAAILSECQKAAFSVAPALDEFNYMSSIPPNQRQERRNMSAEEFVADLPDRLRRVTSADGLPQTDYSREVEFISNVVRTCGTLATKARDLYSGAARSTVPKDYREAVRKVGPQYEICSSVPINVSKQVRNLGPTERGLLLKLGPGHVEDGRYIWQNWRFFDVQVSMDRTSGPDFHHLDQDFLIFGAKIRAE